MSKFQVTIRSYLSHRTVRAWFLIPRRHTLLAGASTRSVGQAPQRNSGSGTDHKRTMMAVELRSGQCCIVRAPRSLISCPSFSMSPISLTHMYPDHTWVRKMSYGAWEMVSLNVYFNDCFNNLKMSRPRTPALLWMKA